jgi:hypothetical protein
MIFLDRKNDKGESKMRTETFAVAAPNLRSGDVLQTHGKLKGAKLVEHLSLKNGAHAWAMTLADGSNWEDIILNSVTLQLLVRPIEENSR